MDKLHNSFEEGRSPSRTDLEQDLLSKLERTEKEATDSRASLKETQNKAIGLCEKLGQVEQELSDLR